MIFHIRFENSSPKPKVGDKLVFSLGSTGNIVTTTNQGLAILLDCNPRKQEDPVWGISYKAATSWVKNNPGFTFKVVRIDGDLFGIEPYIPPKTTLDWLF